ncbi:MAG: histidinol-phosphatase [Clostridia bacterium]|nr:histidinol-phosphatase [Clostridia bacterium]
MRNEMRKLLDRLEESGKQDFDLHMHTTFCDGKNTPEEMVLSAIDKGLKTVGISGHALTFFDKGYCMSNEKLSGYFSQVEGLKEKYADKIKVLCGLEVDYYSSVPEEYLKRADYIIGSVHYIYKDGEYVTVDKTADILKEAAERLWGGDVYAMIDDYYKTVADVVRKLDPDVIGHIDLITKFIEIDEFFDTSDPRYMESSRSAAKALIPFGIPFEINYGAITRGYRTLPYPEKTLLDFISENGGYFIRSSDAHSKENILTAE